MLDVLDLIRPWAVSLAVVLAVFAATVYYMKIRRGLTKPHVLTWVLLASITAITAGVQLMGGAGWSVAPLFFAVAAGYIFVVMAWRRGYMGIVTKSDWICIGLAFFAVGFWLFAKQPAVSVAALSIASVLAFVPTIRKSWIMPDSEPVTQTSLNVARYFLTSIAVTNYGFVTGFYPTLWTAMNLGLTVMLLARRHVLSHRIDEVVDMVVEVPAVEAVTSHSGDPIADAVAAEARRLGPVSNPDDLYGDGPPTTPEYELYDLIATKFMEEPKPDSVTVTDPSNAYGYWVMHRVRMMFADEGFEVSRIPAGNGTPETVTFTHPRVLKRELAALEA